MGNPVIAEMGPLERRAFTFMAAFDLLASIGLVAYLQIRPIDRECATWIWGFALLAVTIGFWIIRWRERHRQGRHPDPGHELISN